MSNIDYYSKKAWVYVLKSKSDMLASFNKFHAFETTQKDLKLKARAEGIRELFELSNEADFSNLFETMGDWTNVVDLTQDD